MISHRKARRWLVNELTSRLRGRLGGRRLGGHLGGRCCCWTLVRCTGPLAGPTHSRLGSRADHDLPIASAVYKQSDVAAEYSHRRFLRFADY